MTCAQRHLQARRHCTRSVPPNGKQDDSRRFRAARVIRQTFRRCSIVPVRKRAMKSVAIYSSARVRSSSSIISISGSGSGSGSKSNLRELGDLLRHFVVQVRKRAARIAAGAAASMEVLRAHGGSRSATPRAPSQRPTRPSDNRPGVSFVTGPTGRASVAVALEDGIGVCLSRDRSACTFCASRCADSLHHRTYLACSAPARARTLTALRASLGRRSRQQRAVRRGAQGCASRNRVAQQRG